MILSRSLRVIGAGGAFLWKAPPGGPWRVYVFNTYSHPGADGSNVNYLDSRLAPAFIEIALEPYARRLGDRLGRSVPGDFIDNEGDYGWGLAWSSTLDERYARGTAATSASGCLSPSTGTSRASSPGPAGNGSTLSPISTPRASGP